MSVVLFAPAKLTVSLRITGARPDGYHEVDAEMVPLMVTFGSVKDRAWAAQHPDHPWATPSTLVHGPGTWNTDGSKEVTAAASVNTALLFTITRSSSPCTTAMNLSVEGWGRISK